MDKQQKGDPFLSAQDAVQSLTDRVATHRNRNLIKLAQSTQFVKSKQQINQAILAPQSQQQNIRPGLSH